MSSQPFDGCAIRQSLDQHGYAVVDDVLGPDFCDAKISELKEWLATFGPQRFPQNSRSLIAQYGVGHLSCAWEIRLAAKPVYAALWGTEKLLSSVDCVCIGQPPESGETEFRKQDVDWLHHDQGPGKIGCHAVQGAVYLEPVDEDDWCLRVLDGSHNFFHEFAENKSLPINHSHEFRRLTEEDVKFFKDKGCKLKTIPAKKGSMILWDSRTAHDNVSPKLGRKHPDRWRFMTLVCMGPAHWATERDLKIKKEAYETVSTTTHWPCREVCLFSGQRNDPEHDLMELPDIAKSKEAKLLMGVLPYDFEDGEPNGPPAPPYKVKPENNVKV